MANKFQIQFACSVSQHEAQGKIVCKVRFQRPPPPSLLTSSLSSYLLPSLVKWGSFKKYFSLTRPRTRPLFPLSFDSKAC